MLTFNRIQSKLLGVQSHKEVEFSGKASEEVETKNHDRHP